jgi:PKHD-type hydroxylase
MIIPPFITYSLLSPKDLSHIRSLVGQCEWFDGLKSTHSMTSAVKENQELKPSPIAGEASQLIFSKLNTNLKFNDFAFPAYALGMIFSKMEVGGFYKSHQDHHTTGNHSTTVFLSDPEDYGGGELCLWLNGEPKEFKLKAGEAITYCTGLPHEVKPVTSGNRLVSVFWTVSRIADLEKRNLIFVSNKVRDILRNDPNNKNKDLIFSSLNEAMENPQFLTHYLTEELSRRYSMPATPVQGPG